MPARAGPAPCTSAPPSSARPSAAPPSTATCGGSCPGVQERDGDGVGRWGGGWKRGAQHRSDLFAASALPPRAALTRRAVFDRFRPRPTGPPKAHLGADDRGARALEARGCSGRHEAARRREAPRGDGGGGVAGAVVHRKQRCDAGACRGRRPGAGGGGRNCCRRGRQAGRGWARRARGGLGVAGAAGRVGLGPPQASVSQVPTPARGAPRAGSDC
jgi:hypothetical protein